MATSPPGSWPAETDLDTKPVPLDIGHPSLERDWKRMETPGEKDGKTPSDRKRAKELPPEIIEQ